MDLRFLDQKTRVSHVIPCDISRTAANCQRQPFGVFKLALVAVFQLAVLLHRSHSRKFLSEPTRRPLFLAFPACTFRYTTWAVLVRFTTFAPRTTRSVVPYAGWLFLFAVLMAAALLFTMVFFVRFSFHFIHNQLD